MDALNRPVVVSVPTEELRSALEGTSDLDLLVWDLRSAPPREVIDLVVVPYMSSPQLLRQLEGVRTLLVQSQSIGYDGVIDQLPADVRFSNGAGIHEASTAELAIGLMIASQRLFPAYVRAQSTGEWTHEQSRALTGSRVVVIGQGGVGTAINERLRPFEVDLVRVATSRRTDEAGIIHGLSELDELLDTADIVLLAVPLTDATRGMVDASFLERMPRGSLLVNVSRGPVVVTDDLVAAVRSKQVRAAVDVVDPEPLPPDHPLWTLDGVLITPHIGGDSSAMHPRVVRLLLQQISALRDGAEPVNVVRDPTAALAPRG
jgi:phosphoglycerate dehydrogenase-like enzyme